MLRTASKRLCHSNRYYVIQSRKLCNVQQQHSATSDASAVSHKRVFGIAAHIDAGKTTTCEAILHASGTLGRSRMGRVDRGDTALDFLPAERERGITIQSASAKFLWRNHQVFLVDSPGHLDFSFEVERALRVMDSVVILVDAVAGVQPQTEAVWQQANRANLPRLMVVNKMDREGSRLDSVIDECAKHFGVRAPLIQLPLTNIDGTFVGVLDLVTLKLTSSQDRADLCIEKFMSAANQARDKLIEVIADVDDTVMGLYLDEATVSAEVLRDAIRAACRRREIVPVLCSAALKNVGVHEIMDAVVDYLPSPCERGEVCDKFGRTKVLNSTKAPFIAQAFKVTHDKHRGRLVHLRAFSGVLEDRKHPLWNSNKQMKERPSKWLHMLADDFTEQDRIECGDVFAMVGLKHTETGDTLTVSGSNSEVILKGMEVPPSVCSVAIETESSTAQRELEEYLGMRLAEDPSLKLETDTNTGELLLSGLGELHLESVVDRARSELPIELFVSRPRVAYRETVTGSAKHFEVYDAKIGNAHLVASLNVEIRGADDEMAPNTVFVRGDNWTKEERAALLDGVTAGLSRGLEMGLPTLGIHVTVWNEDEQKFDVAALRACANAAARTAMKKANPVVVEPVMKVELDVPSIHQGDVVSALTHPVECRGRIVSAEPSAAGMKICADIPLDGMIGWARKMRSLCKGRGTFSMLLNKYEQVPPYYLQHIKSN